CVSHPGPRMTPAARRTPAAAVVALSAVVLLLFPTAAGVAASATPTIHVASGRLVDALGRLAAEPAEAIRYSAHQVDVPRAHRPERISREFRSAESIQFASRSDFTAAIVDQSRRHFGTSEVLVYVHGFGISFAESLARATQLHVDLDIPAATVLYA